MTDNIIKAIHHSDHYALCHEIFKLKDSNLYYKEVVKAIIESYLNNFEGWDVFVESVIRVEITKEGLSFILINDEKPVNCKIDYITNIFAIFNKDLTIRARDKFSDIRERKYGRRLSYNMRFFQLFIMKCSIIAFSVYTALCLIFVFLNGITYTPIWFLTLSSISLIIWGYAKNSLEWINTYGKEKFEEAKEKGICEIVFDFEYKNV